MKQKKKKFTIFLIITLYILSLYGLYDYMSAEFSSRLEMSVEREKQSAIEEFVEREKARSEYLVNQLYVLLENRHSTIKPKIKEELTQEVRDAYDTAHSIYNKYKGKKPTREIQELIKDRCKQIFITDFKGNSILKGSQTIDDKEFASYTDAEYRSTVLEEIQKVRRFKEGFLESKRAKDAKQEIIYVKNLDLYDWFIGVVILEDDKRLEAQKKFLEFMQKIPLGKNELLGVISKNEVLSLSPRLNEKFNEAFESDYIAQLTPESKWYKESSGSRYYYTKHYADFDWYLLYSFDSKFKKRP